MEKKILISILIFLVLSSVVMASHTKIKKQPVSSYQLRNSFAPNQLDAIEKREYSFGTCLDSDSGRNYFKAGFATYFPPITARCQGEFAAAMEICRMVPIGNCLDLLSYECRPRTTGDRCISGSTLREAYCSDNYLRTIDYRCPSGCYIGQCISFR